MSFGILEMENNPEIQKAHEYFSVLNTPKTAMLSNKTKNAFSGVNPYGMVDFIQMFNKAARFTTVDDDLTAVMESLSNILIAAVLKHAGASKQEQVSSKNWREGFNAMAGLFFSTYSVDELTYNDQKVGKEVVEEVIKVGFDVNGQPQGNLKKAIQGYLKKQGELMNQLTFDGKHSNPYTLMGFVNFKNNENHICSLRAYFTEFDANTVKISHSCGEDETKFDFNFKVTNCNADFMLSKWETSAEFRERIKNFINAHTPDSPYFDILETSHRFTVV